MSTDFVKIELRDQNRGIVNSKKYFWAKMEDLEHKNFFLRAKVSKVNGFSTDFLQTLSDLRSRSQFALR